MGKAAGFNGYTPEEIEQFGKDDLKVLSELLGDKQFFFGDDPNHLDLVAFSQLALVLNVDDSENGVKCPLKEFINAECTNLVGHYNRMKDRAWGDHWDEAIGEKMELNPHIPKPDPPKVEEKKEEAEDKKEDAEDKKEEDKEKADSDEKEKRKRKRRSPSNLAQDHYINKKEPTRSHPARTLPRVSPPAQQIQEEKKRSAQTAKR